MRVLKPLRCRGCGSPGVRRGGGSRLMQRELDGNGMGGGLRPDSVIQVCERQRGRWAPARSLPGPGVRPTPPLVSARHPPPVVPTPPWCPADTPRRKYSVRTDKEEGWTRTHETTCVVLRDRGRPQQPAGVGRRARRAGPAGLESQLRPAAAMIGEFAGTRADRPTVHHLGAARRADPSYQARPVWIGAR